MRKQIVLSDKDMDRLKHNNMSEFWKFFTHIDAKSIQNDALLIYLDSPKTLGQAVLAAIAGYNLRLTRTRLE